MAKDKVVHAFDINDPDLGAISVTVVDVKEPIDQPFLMSVSVRCKGKIKSRKLIKHEAICEMQEHEWNKDTKELILHYKTSEYVPGDAECNGRWKKRVNLRSECGK